MANLVIDFKGYIDGVHHVIIRDEKDCKTKSFLQIIEKEVKNLPKKRRKKFFKLIMTAPLLLSTLITTGRANAQSITTAGQIKIDSPFISKEDTSIIPMEIWEILIQLISSAGKIGFLLAILLVMIAGGMAMFGRKDKAKAWISEIIKGYGIILLSPIVIKLLTSLVTFLLGGTSGLNMFY